WPARWQCPRPPHANAPIPAPDRRADVFRRWWHGALPRPHSPTQTAPEPAPDGLLPFAAPRPAAPPSALQPFDGFRAARLPLTVQGDGGYFFFGFFQLGFTALFQRRATFIKRDGFVQRHIAAFKPPDHLFKLGHGLLKTH